MPMQTQRSLDVRVTIHATEGDVTFKDTKEGTFGVRTHPNLRLDREGEEFASMTGIAVNSEGDQNHDLWGKRARWVDYSGSIDGQSLGVAMFDHPANPRHPTWWHARNYGLVAANPFGIHDFENLPNKPSRGDFTIKKGETAAFLYRVLLHRGDAKQADVARHYQQFAEQGRKLQSRGGDEWIDGRREQLQDFNGYFPMTPPKSQAEWEERSSRLRRRIQIAAGLWPMPARPPVDATIHGRVERNEYSVEKVYFESRPGFYVTGNLYRPKGFSGPRPAVLCPHGHWPEGRFQDVDADDVQSQIASGAEQFENAARHVIQARCVHLARLGCVVFAYDMIGYADSQQIPLGVAHTLHHYRPEMDGRDAWGLFSTQAELRLINVFGLQTFNSIRALDWVCSLPDVDAQRIGVTGASGGGTQTMMLCAIDPRPAVSFPAVMVSTSMQGGCTCENACLLRVDGGNIDIAGLFAPKPLAMTTADDWTRELLTKGLPELQVLFQIYGKKDNVRVYDHVQFPHNYNGVSRAGMYEWMNANLNLGHDDPSREGDFVPLSQEELSVWNDEHPAPQGGPEFERKLVAAIDRDAALALDQLRPRDKSSLDQFRKVAGGAVETLLNRASREAASAPEFRQTASIPHGEMLEVRGELRAAPHGAVVPIALWRPSDANGHVVIVLHGDGMQSQRTESGELRGELEPLLAEGFSIVLADLFLQGSSAREGHPPLISRKVHNPRDYAGFTFGYNDTLFAQRVSDIRTVVAYAHDLKLNQEGNGVHLIGLRGVGPHVTAARALAGAEIDTAAVDTAGFRFESIASWRDRDFLPGIVKYGDLPALLALNAPHPLWIAGEKAGTPDLVEAAYAAADSNSNLHQSDAAAVMVTKSAVEWVIRNAIR